MERRNFIRVLSAGAAIGAGCLESNDLSEVDSDGDGVPDSKDYAPNNPSIQKQSDLYTENGTIRPVGERGTLQVDIPSKYISFETDDWSELDSKIMEYSDDSCKVKVGASDKDSESQKLLVIGQAFPRGQALTYGVKNLETSEKNEVVEVELRNKLSTEGEAHYTAYLIPKSVSVKKLTQEDMTYLHETDPFSIDDGTLHNTETPYQQNVKTETAKRKKVEGGWITTFNGTVNDKKWEMAFFTSVSSYTIRKQQQHDELTSVGLAISNSTSVNELATIVEQSAMDAELKTDHERASLVLDMVRRLPNSPTSPDSTVDDSPQYLLETIVEMGGDAMDTAIFASTLMWALGLDNVVLEFEDHYAVGVPGDYSGAHVSYNGTNYYYAETLETSTNIGEVPEGFDGEASKIYNLKG